MIKHLIVLSALAMGITTTAQAELVQRLNGLAYYDTDADITWLADANYARTTGYDADGKMNWQEAATWVSSLNVEGVTGWRLPTMAAHDPSCSYQGMYGIPVENGTQDYPALSYGYNCQGGELGNMYINVLGGTPYVAGQVIVPLYQSHNANYALFSNVMSVDFRNSMYWTNLQFEPAPESFWAVDMYANYTASGHQSYEGYVWAVHDGDVAVVPVPAAAWLFATGLVGLLGISRRKQPVESEI